jgi:general secretion pathway protein H
VQPVTTTARPNGFTLVELLVVLTVIGLIMALAPIAMYSAMPSLELRTTTRELAAALRSTRSAAIRDNREAALTLDVEAGWYRRDGRERQRKIDPEIQLKLLTATIEAEDDSVGRIRFFPDGTSTGGQITLARGEQTYYIVIDWLSGRVQVADRIEE